MSNAPKVGDGATLQIGSDSYPCTIIRISPSGKTLSLQRDSYRRTDSNGQSESQEYEFGRNPNGEIFQARFSSKRERWESKGRPVSLNGRRAYFDPSF